LVFSPIDNEEPEKVPGKITRESRDKGKKRVLTKKVRLSTACR